MARSNSIDKVDNGALAATTPAANNMKFEAALAELEQIVQKMESGQLALEESIVAYRRGSELLALCQHKLSDAEQRIQVLENGALRDFDANNETAR